MFRADDGHCHAGPELCHAVTLPGVVTSGAGPVLTAGSTRPARPARALARSERWRPGPAVRMRDILLALRCVAGAGVSSGRGWGAAHPGPASQD